MSSYHHLLYLVVVNKKSSTYYMNQMKFWFQAECYSPLHMLSCNLSLICKCLSDSLQFRDERDIMGIRTKGDRR